MAPPLKLGLKLPAICSLLLAIFQVVGATEKCYLPNGKPAYGDIPCGKGFAGQCCAGPGGVCLSNGLCFSPSNGLLSRMSCTDKSWSASNCSTYCSGVLTYEYLPLTPCGDGTFCCGIGEHPDNCCINKHNNFKVKSAASVLNLAAASSTCPVEVVTVTITHSFQPTSNPTHSSCPTITVGPSAAAGAALGASSTSTPTASCNSNSAAIGAGVGVPLFIICLILAGLLIWQIRKRKASERSEYQALVDRRQTTQNGFAAVPPHGEPEVSQRPISPPTVTHSPAPEPYSPEPKPPWPHGYVPAYGAAHELGRSNTGMQDPRPELGGTSPAPMYPGHDGPVTELPRAHPWYPPPS